MVDKSQARSPHLSGVFRTLVLWSLGCSVQSVKTISVAVEQKQGCMEVEPSGKV